MIHHTHLLLLLSMILALAIVLAGCGVQPTAEPGDASAEQISPAALSPAEDESDATDPESDEQDSAEPASTAFVPPFPERTNPFLVPERRNRATAKAEGILEAEIELLGFVNVGVRRAVLSVDGRVTPIAEGERREGIEVISIQPPAVVLQRGRQRWQASLAN